MGFIIESLVAGLLLLTIGYCVILNHRLKRLKSDEHALRVTISELMTATEIAERAVAGLKATADEYEDTLGERIKAAERIFADLNRQVKAGELLVSRVSRIVVAARSPEAASAPASGGADPKALAAAAKAFAERARQRANVLAA
jgi:hypothetical protein